MSTLRPLFLLALGTLAIASPAHADPRWLHELRARVAAQDWSAIDSLAVPLVARAERQPGRDSLWLAETLDAVVRAGRLVRTVDSVLVGAAERAHGLHLRRRGAEARETAQALQMLGTVRWLNGDLAGGRARVEQAFPVIERGFGPASEEVAGAIASRATILLRAGERAIADSLLRRGLAICSTGVARPTTHGLLLMNMAYRLRTEGEHVSALAHIERAVEVMTTAPGDRGRDLARALVAHGTMLYDAGRFAEAEAVESRGVVMMERAYGPTHPDVCTALKNLANSREYVYGTSASRAIYERVLAIEEAGGPGRQDPMANTLLNLGETLALEGDWIGARRAHERSVAIRERVLGPKHPRLATSLGRLAADLSALGEHDEALRHLDRALAIREARGEAGALETARTRFERANALNAAGRAAEAADDAARAAATFTARLGPQHFEVAQAQVTFAEASMRLGHAARAESLFALAVPALEAVLATDHPLVAAALRERAAALLALGDTPRARAALERALAMVDASLGPEHPDRAEALRGLAAVARREGRAREAFDHALAAERIGREHARLAARSLTEREALRLSAARVAGLDVALEVLPALGAEAADPAWEAVAGSRALVLDALAERRRALAGVAAGDSLVAEHEAASRAWAHALVAGAAGGEPADLARRLRQARERRERAERALAERAAVRSGIARAAGAAEVRAALPSDAALVSYVRHGDGAAARYTAFVVRAGQPAIRHALGSAAALDASVERWRNELTRAPRRGDPAALARCDAAGRVVRRAAWDPLLPSLAGATRVFLVPDGALQLMPFAALPATSGGWLIDAPRALHVLTCERDLAVAPLPAVTNERSLLAVGGPGFDDDAGTIATDAPAGDDALAAATTRGLAACRAFREVRFEPLPAAVREAAHVADLARQAGFARVEVLTGAAASEAAFKRLAPASRVLHLATHGFFVTGDCLDPVAGSRGIGGTAPASVATATPAAARRAAEADALQLSGLALAGANRRAGVRGEDGILTAEEIAALDLGGVEWAVLSACDTGVGAIGLGEGVFGLRRALETAGVRSTVLSLWEVEDATAQRWAGMLYRARWSENLGASDAVRAAARELLASRRASGESPHPFHWAAFVATGDWR